MHLSSASTRVGGTLCGYGDFANYCSFQSSCISSPMGDFFLAEFPVFKGGAKQLTGHEDALILVLEQLANAQDN